MYHMSKMALLSMSKSHSHVFNHLVKTAHTKNMKQILHGSHRRAKYIMVYNGLQKTLDIHFQHVPYTT